MKGRLKCSGNLAKRSRLLKIGAGCLILAVLVAAGFNLTKEKATGKATQDTAVEMQEETLEKENEGWELIAQNPLKKNTDSDIDRKIREYYTQKISENGFAEGYNNIEIYLKKARYENCYVAFVEYTMKIKDIYTEVPGMETLYLQKEEEEWQIISGTSDEQIAQEAEEIASHDDVQKLMADVQQNYVNAVASDAMLAEALADLEQASSQ